MTRFYLIRSFLAMDARGIDRLKAWESVSQEIANAIDDCRIAKVDWSELAALELWWDKQDYRQIA